MSSATHFCQFSCRELKELSSTESKSSGKMEPHRLWSYMFTGVCFIGLIFQVYNVSYLYFSYDIQTSESIGISKTLEVPDLSVCANYAEVIDIQWLNQYFNVSLVKSYTTQYIRAVQNRVNIQQILERTPSTDKLIMACKIRQPESYTFLNLTGDDCRDKFVVTKYHLQEFICYRFSPTFINSNQYKTQYLAYSLAYSGMFYLVALDLKHTLISDANYGRIFLHSSQSSKPLRAASFAPMFIRGFSDDFDGDNRISHFNYFWITYTILNNERLPPPFRTGCRNYSTHGFSSAFECFSRCMTTHFNATFQKISFLDITTQPSEVKILNSEDLDDEETSRMIRIIEQNCSSSCSQPDCHETYTISKLQSEVDEDVYLTFGVACPQEPFVSVSFTPMISLVEYLIYVLGMFGIWFGLHVLSFSPNRIAERLIACINHRRDQAVDSKRNSNVFHPSDQNCSACKFCVKFRKNVYDMIDKQLR